MLIRENTPPLKPRILVDHREANTRLHELLTLTPGTTLDKANLPFGDYVISDIGIERKTANDFLQSLADGRLFDQLIGLKRHYRRRILLIEGHVPITSDAQHAAAIRGACLRVVAGFQIPTLRSQSAEHSARLLLHLARQEARKTCTAKMPRKKPSEIIHDQLNVLAAIPFVGMQRAKSLIQHFKTLKGVFNSNIEELGQVSGIGEKQARAIFELVNREF